MYDYRCHQCGETFEVMQKFADEPLKIHEGCGGEVERLISLPALQFKGTGWYVTDYGKTTKDAKSESEAKSDKSEKSDKKSTKESSPAKKSDKPSTTKASSND